jgi:abortive infection bacteriophage resistance protein
MIGPTTPATPLNDAHQAGFLLHHTSQFKKPALGTEQMIENLISHGMNFEDLKSAKFALQTINYYRLSTYWFPFKVEKGNGEYRFEDNLDFSTVIKHHEFDRILRHKVMQGVEIIEIALRRSLASELSLSHDPFALLNPACFADKTLWERQIERIRKDFDESKEEFALHFKKKYPELQLPPIWVATEIITFGMLSQIYANISSVKIKSAISRNFGLDQIVLRSFLHHLTGVRILCAHHARLWNRKFVIKPILPRNIPESYKNKFNRSQIGQRQLFNTLVIMDFVISKLRPDFHFLEECHEIFSKYPDINPIYVGMLNIKI